MFELSQMAGYLESFLKKLKISQVPRHLGNFPDTQAFGKFPRYPGIWEIAIGKFPRYPGIWEIPQIPTGI